MLRPSITWYVCRDYLLMSGAEPKVERLVRALYRTPISMTPPNTMTSRNTTNQDTFIAFALALPDFG